MRRRRSTELRNDATLRDWEEVKLPPGTDNPSCTPLQVSSLSATQCWAVHHLQVGVQGEEGS